MSTDYLNPMASTYDSIIKILKSLTIKYSYLAEEAETTESQLAADEYLDAIDGKTDFDSYVDYTYDDMISVGITDYSILSQAVAGDTSVIPVQYRQQLYEIRVAKIINNYVEKNNYYRMLNGLPDLEEDPKYYFYITESMAENFHIDRNIPVHMIQDYYNRLNPGDGDYYISLIEGSGYIKKLYEANPDKKYLDFIGSNRIPIDKSRKAKNFQILLIRDITIKQILYTEFTNIYEQCREYFINVVYNRSFRGFIDYYDQFIALCIMVMTIQQLVVKQMTLGIHREFFDIYALKMLYEVYGIPYNLNLDEESQQQIVRNLNLFVRDKATNKVIYNIAEALGFGSNFSIYKYYLSKQHKVDSFGVPIFKETQKFNDAIGAVETVPDYDAMYDVYFHKAELKDNNFVNTFNSAANTNGYTEIVEYDPYWWLDERTYERVWETEYNFVESKYLGLSVSYKITNMIFENIILMKLMISKEEELRGIRLTLPKLTSNVEIPVFDVIILLICLTAAKHNLTGEIVTLPTDVMNVLDFMAEIGEYEGKDITEYLADTYSFDFDYFASDEWANQKVYFKKHLSEEDYDKLIRLTSVLALPTEDNKDLKVEALNTMYENIKGLYKFIELKMTEEKDLHTYRQLRKLHRMGFYSREMKNLFDIVGEFSGFKRTAFNFFEYLRVKNPALYEAVFTVDYLTQYEAFMKQHEELALLGYSYDQFVVDSEVGKVSEEFTTEEIPIRIKFDTIKDAESDNTSVKDEKIYFYINHCISRLENVIYNLNYTYMLGDAATPLENLLIRMIQFFKSYTTELINLENVYIVDLKPDNIIKIFDLIHKMDKEIWPKEELHLSYSDIVDVNTEMVVNGGRISLLDKYIYEIWIILDNRQQFGNYLKLREELMEMNKNLFIDYEKFDLNDRIAKTDVNIYQNDNVRFKDKIIKMYYSD